MGEKKGEDLYHNFSRKDIQGLCKKYGLPANKSNLEMATSLILYLEKKNLNSRTMWEATRSNLCPLGTSKLQVGAGMALTDDQRTDCRGTASNSGSGNNQHNNQDVQPNESQNCKGVTSDKASEIVGIITQLHRHSNNGVGLPENAFSSVVNSPVAARSTDFQFDVRSEDGIQLCVDLNSTLSDWIENMKNGVHICRCHDVYRGRSQSLQKDLGRLCSKQMKSSPLVDNRNLEDGSSPTTLGTGVQVQAAEPDIGEGSLCSPGLKPCGNAVQGQENMGEEQAISSRMESPTEKEGAKSCEREDKTVPAGSTVNIATQIRTFNFSVKSCDPKHSGMLENLVLDNNIHEKSPLQQINGLPNPTPKYMVLPESALMEVEASSCTTLGQDVAPSTSRVGKSLDLAAQPQYTEREHSGLPPSAQFHGNLHQLQSVEIADVSRYATCSGLSGSIDDEHCRAPVSNKCSRQLMEMQTHLATCRGESMSLSPYERYGSLDIVHLTNNIETDNGGPLRPREPGQETVDVHSSVVRIQREDELLSSCSNGVSPDMVVPEQNGADHCILTCSNELDEENGKSQPATCVLNLGKSHVGVRKESSECLDRDLMERICLKPANSESSGELKRKRLFSGIEDQSNCFNSDSRILRTSKQSTGDVHASRRRSSRLFTK